MFPPKTIVEVAKNAIAASMEAMFRAESERQEVLQLAKEALADKDEGKWQSARITALWAGIRGRAAVMYPSENPFSDTELRLLWQEGFNGSLDATIPSADILTHPRFQRSNLP